MTDKKTIQALGELFLSHSQTYNGGVPGNVADGLFAIADAVNKLADAVGDGFVGLAHSLPQTPNTDLGDAIEEGMKAVASAITDGADQIVCGHATTFGVLGDKIKKVKEG
jgi:hypothetical protein